jgi:hypothetical protein
MSPLEAETPPQFKFGTAHPNWKTSCRHLKHKLPRQMQTVFRNVTTWSLVKIRRHLTQNQFVVFSADEQTPRRISLFMVGLLFRREEGSIILHRNVGELISDWTASQRKPQIITRITRNVEGLHTVVSMATYTRLNGVTLIVAAEETSNLHENHTECWGASHSGLHGNLYQTERRHANSCRRGNLKSSRESDRMLRGFTQWSPWQLISDWTASH